MFPNISIIMIPLKKTLNFWEEECTVDPDKLPANSVTNGESVGIYATSGYNVGTGDMLIRIMEEVPRSINLH